MGSSPRLRPAIVLATVAALVALGFTGAEAVTYVYNGGINGNWQSSASWNPVRTTPSPTDILTFPNGTGTILNVPDQSVQQVVLSPGAQVRLVSELNGLRTLTITGGIGEDLVVPAGASLGNENDTPMRLQLAAGATGSIAGDIVLEGPTRFFVGSAGALVFTNGGRCIATSTFDGNMFGTLPPYNAVVFQAGSLYESGGGSNPFGATEPNGLVVFQPGSLYRHKHVISPSMSGRTYGNFEFDAFGVTTQSIGPSGVTVDSIDVKHGVYWLQLSGSSNIRGSIHVGEDAGFKIGHSTLNTVYTLNGTTTQNLRIDHIDFPGGLISFDATPTTTLRIDNPNGVQVTNLSPVLSYRLEFLRGKLVIPDVEIGHPMFMFGNADVIGASQATGWIAGGYIYAPVKPAAPSRLFPMGDLVSYAPLLVTYHGLADSMQLLAMSQVPVGPRYYPYFTMAGIDSTKKANRVALFLESSSPPVAYTNYDVVFGWGPADMDPGADPSLFVGRAQSHSSASGPVQDPTIGFRTPTSIQMLGLTNLGSPSWSFVAGEPATALLTTRNASTFEDGSAAIAPGPQTATGASLVFAVSLLPVSMTPVSVDYAVANGTADASDYTPVSGTLNFAPGDTVEYVTVQLSGDSTPERNETVQLTLSNAVGATIAQPSATGTILDDDDVTAPTVTVTAPNGGESFVAGSVVPLHWDASDDVAVASVTLRIKRDHPQPSILVATDVPNTGTYLWTSSTELTSTARLFVVAFDDRGNSGNDLSDGDWSLTDPTAVETPGAYAFALGRVSPNPLVSGATGTIEYVLPHDAQVELTVIDVRGRRVATIESGTRAAGAHRASWSGGELAPGLYFVRLTTPGFEAVRRVVVGS